MRISKETGLGLLSAIFRAYFRLCYRTSTIEIEESEQLNNRIFNERKGAIVASWHNRLVFCAKWGQEMVIESGRPLTTLVSSSSDGDIASRVSQDMGATVARGSSSRRGVSGMREILRSARQNPVLAFLVDGPRGPIYQSKKGVIEAARLTGFPIYPWAASCSRAIFLSSWDRMVLPLPFSEVRIRLGDPIWVPRRSSKEDMAEVLANLDQVLRKNTADLDRELNLPKNGITLGNARKTVFPRAEEYSPTSTDLLSIPPG